MMIEQP
jgi:hypothetical protein